MSKEVSKPIEVAVVSECLAVDIHRYRMVHCPDGCGCLQMLVHLPEVVGIDGIYCYSLSPPYTCQ